MHLLRDIPACFKMNIIKNCYGYSKFSNRKKQSPWHKRSPSVSESVWLDALIVWIAVFDVDGWWRGGCALVVEATDVTAGRCCSAVLASTSSRWLTVARVRTTRAWMFVYALCRPRNVFHTNGGEAPWSLLPLTIIDACHSVCIANF